MCESRYDSVRSNMCRPSTQALRLAAVVLVPWYFGAAVQCLTLMIDRATASSLLVEISCDSCESNSFMWEYKSSPEETWGNLPRLIDHLYNPNAFYITKLKENTLHYLRVRYNPTGQYSNEIKEWTCEKVPPTVNGPAGGGARVPGWLDVRWTRPQERCKRFYYYDVRYQYATRRVFSRTMRFGYFDVSHSKAYVKPSHPCSGGDFCVLLTDHVVAGSHHQIEIERIGGENESSGEFRLSGLASTDNTGAEDFIVCPDTKKKTEDSSFDEDYRS
ncbi:Protein of unknown function [Gryllus bimaculatus]|nr:Protein of unknown function [Gryllus bimaculatus]